MRKSNWIISPGRGENKKNIWNHHPTNFRASKKRHRPHRQMVHVHPVFSAMLGSSNVMCWVVESLMEPGSLTCICLENISQFKIPGLYIITAHTIHVRHTYLHLVNFYGNCNCRKIYHTIHGCHGWWQWKDIYFLLMAFMILQSVVLLSFADETSTKNALQSDFTIYSCEVDSITKIPTQKCQMILPGIFPLGTTPKTTHQVVPIHQSLPSLKPLVPRRKKSTSSRWVISRTQKEGNSCIYIYMCIFGDINTKNICAYKHPQHGYTTKNAMRSLQLLVENLRSHHGKKGCIYMCSPVKSGIRTLDKLR